VGFNEIVVLDPAPWTSRTRAWNGGPHLAVRDSRSIALYASAYGMDTGCSPGRLNVSSHALRGITLIFWPLEHPVPGSAEPCAPWPPTCRGKDRQPLDVHAANRSSIIWLIQPPCIGHLPSYFLNR